MSTELTLLMHNAEGALLRVLGTLERRGFRVLEFHGMPRGDCTEMRLAVDGRGRCVEVMVRQLQRIEDVRDVRAGVPQRATVLRVTPMTDRRSRRTLDFFGIPEPRHQGIAEYV